MRRTWCERARRSVPAAAQRANVFTRLMLARSRIHPVARVPVMPVEIMLLPKWFPFHLDKISYWAAPSSCRCWCCRRSSRRRATPRAWASTNSSSSRRSRSARRRGRRTRRVLVLLVSRHRCRAARDRAVVPKRSRQRAIDTRGGLRRRAPQRRGRPRRDLSGDGEQRDDVRRARLSRRSSAARDRAPLDRQAARRSSDDEAYCQPCVSPVWDTGSPATPCSRWAASAADAGAQRPRMADAAAGARREGRLDRAAARRAARRLGVPIRQSALSRRRRHRGGGDGDGPRARLERRTDFDAAIARGTGMDRGYAKRERRLGRLRRRQPAPTISTTSRSPTTARCSIRRPRTSPRAASRCWRSSARPQTTARRWRARSTICAARRWRRSWYGRWGMNYIYGTWSVLCALNAAGVDRPRIPGIPQGGRVARPRSRMPTAAGARTARATSSITAAMSRPRARRRRRPGRCSA